MSRIKVEILNCLKDLKGSGKFISVHTTEFQFPGLEVNGVGEIAYPVNATQANALIQVAQKAPFGKGSKTILDKSIRSGWEIDAKELSFNGSQWDSFLNKVLKNIKPDLGLEDYTVSAHLYKMLIYEKGDFFLQHKDSEKEKGMFGTLIISLPSKHTGGELEVIYEGVKEVVDFTEASGNYKINYTAFYADCDHEIKPLTSGYRICLVYNLIQEKTGKRIHLNSIETYADKLAEIFAREQQSGNLQPHIVLLGHQYTPENFSLDDLKLNDRPKAAALLRAAQKAGCYAKMCLVTSYLLGSPENDNGYDDDWGDDAEMAEVYDDSLYIEHWLANELPPLNHVGFNANDLIASFTLNDDEPIIKESTGYMGNYGPDLMYWYHYGAVIIWSREANVQLLLQQSTKNKLEWISYYDSMAEQISDSEITAVNLLLATGLDNDKPNENANFNAIADWVINRKDDAFFLRLDDQVSQFYFIKISASYWLKLANYFSSEIIEKIFIQVTKNSNTWVIQHLLAVLRTFSDTEKLNHLIIPQLKELPHHFHTLLINPAKNEYSKISTALGDLFWIEKKLPQDEAWIIQFAEILTSYREQIFINQVLLPQLLILTERTEFTHKIMLSCKEYLQERVNNKPAPPTDWRREMPATTADKKQWQLLRAFLESPDQLIFDYRKNQQERSEMENAIKNVEIDLIIQTLKKSSPHTLRITKTLAAYHKKMKIWDEELELLNKLRGQL